MSRSRDDLNLEQPQVEEDDDVWHATDTCFQVSYVQYAPQLIDLRCGIYFKNICTIKTLIILF